MVDTRFGKNTAERMKSFDLMLLVRNMAMKNASTTFNPLVAKAYSSVWGTDVDMAGSVKNSL